MAWRVSAGFTGPDVRFSGSFEPRDPTVLSAIRTVDESDVHPLAAAGASMMVVLRLAHTKRAKSYEVFGSLNPQFATAGHRGAATEAVKRLRAFRAQYTRALAKWTAGDRTACFPEGTWWMRVCHGARCGPGP